MLNFEKYKDELNEYSDDTLDKAMRKVYAKYANNTNSLITNEEVVNWFSKDSEKVAPELSGREKCFIKNIVEPFAQSYEITVRKARWPVMEDSNVYHEAIAIDLQNPTCEDDYYSLEFPNFEAGTRYKGMIPGVTYTLDDLKIYLTPKIKF